MPLSGVLLYTVYHGASQGSRACASGLSVWRWLLLVETFPRQPRGDSSLCTQWVLQAGGEAQRFHQFLRTRGAIDIPCSLEVSGYTRSSLLLSPAILIRHAFCPHLIHVRVDIKNLGTVETRRSIRRC